MFPAAKALAAKTMPALAQPVSSPVAGACLDGLPDAIVWMLVMFVPLVVILGAWILLQTAKYAQDKATDEALDKDLDGWFTERAAVPWTTAPKDFPVSEPMTAKEHEAYVKTIKWPTSEEAAMRQFGIPVAKAKSEW